MAQRRVAVTFTYQKKDVNPPIYVAGSFSDPPWHPHEMDFTVDQHGEHFFTKQVMVENGAEIQYKFRIGPTDWWVINEVAETITDHQGNVNNFLKAPIETPEESALKELDAHAREPEQTTIDNGAQAADIAKSAAEAADSATVLDLDPPKPELSDEAEKANIRRLSVTPDDQPTNVAKDVAVTPAVDDSDSGSTSSEEATGDGDSCPVFSHESMGPPTHEEELFSNSDSNNDGSESRSDTQQGDSAIDADSVDFDDPQLEVFPSSNRDSILAAVRRISTSVDADRTVVEGITPSSLAGASQQQTKTNPAEASNAESTQADAHSGDEQDSQLDKSTYLSSSIDSNSRSASVSSLGLIAEDDSESLSGTTVDETDKGTIPFVQHSGPVMKWDSTFEDTTREEDEGIAMDYESKRASREFQYKTGTQVLEPTVLSEDSASMVAESNPEETKSVPADKPSDKALGDGHPASAEKESPKDTLLTPEPHTLGSHKSGDPNLSISDESQTRSASINPSSPPSLRKRTVDKPNTPSPAHHARGASKYPSWLEACLQVAFVRWLGVFASWLYSRRHRALMVTGTAVIVVGVGLLWQKPVHL
ncbi:hypothetical protein GGS23DRAFT_589438 [Durotheca rogersii]|uniref:uncharacterized protein n=1 Tax=Durotheca rogersii TaxID=419775 RepID=UPI0022209A29|nr:uncharacterized protein GGS23DRAFT_589438 [Durotheca rogersii]KAI5855575.1 hypothetical protein GGS23DRAFT_589438 [Durotheca rogersii]